MKNTIFDMETGDPDDLITLIMLLSNPNINLRAITCYEGSPIQIGLINHILSLAQKNIPVGGLNSFNPQQLNPYYLSVVGQWSPAYAAQSPIQVFEETFSQFPDTWLITGAPLTNIAQAVSQLDITIPKVFTQGGYIGELVQNPLEKFKGKQEIRTYNLSQDAQAFDTVYNSSKIQDITFITKDLCHGFLYTPDIHKTITFGNSPLDQLLKKCLEHYALKGKSKALHDPLAMLYMLHPEIGTTKNIHMSYRTNDKNHNIFSSVEDFSSTNKHALTQYNSEMAWNIFKELCNTPTLKKTQKLK